MPGTQHQQYGLFVPHLKTFMYFNGTKEEFEALLRQFGSQEPQEKSDLRHDFNDFDYVVEEVAQSPYSKMSRELLEFDF